MHQGVLRRDLIEFYESLRGFLWALMDPKGPQGVSGTLLDPLDP